MGDEDLVLSAHAPVCEGRDAVEGLEWGRGRSRWQEKVVGRFLHKTAVWQLFCPQSALLGLIILVFWPLGTSNMGYAIKNSKNFFTSDQSVSKLRRQYFTPPLPQR